MPQNSFTPRTFSSSCFPGDIKALNKKTVLGFGWAILQLVLSIMVVFSIVFGELDHPLKRADSLSITAEISILETFWRVVV